MLATEYSSLRTPKKKNNTTKTRTSNHLPIIIHLSHHFSDSCGTPMAPSRNTWLKRIIASLSPLSADNFHHFTASRNLADWRKSSPKNLPNVTEGVFRWWVFFGQVKRSNFSRDGPVFPFVYCWAKNGNQSTKLKLRFAGVSQGTLFLDTTRAWHVYDWPAQVARFPKKKATWSLILLICWHFIDVKAGSGWFWGQRISWIDLKKSTSTIHQIYGKDLTTLRSKVSPPKVWILSHWNKKVRDRNA